MENKNDYYYEDRSSVPFHNRTKRPRSTVANTAMFITGAVLICVLSVVISSVVAGQKIKQAQQEPQNVIIYRSDDEHPHFDAGGDGNRMSVAEVAATVRDSVVEIHTGALSDGSGVIITDCGYIITNLASIENASAITVTLADGTACGAYLRGYDEKTDIAIIKLNGACEGLMPAILGDSTRLVLGEEVIAIGNAANDMGVSVTDGIISANQRDINVDDIRMSLLLTNIPVNPGCGLFNSFGELVGLINVRVPEVGLGFAIPMSVAGDVAEAIILQGFVSGRVDTEAVQLYDISPGTSYPIPMYDRGAGLYVKANYQNFQEYDYIVSIEGTQISGKRDWKRALINHDAGDVVSVVVRRRGSDQPVQIEFTLPERTTLG